ncbi:MAG TPA: hypothetical protein DGH68_12060, partial [Bacteroidetes bacterium]|nr:hypothetical protein [Bacteroidota bacterium]
MKTIPDKQISRNTCMKKTVLLFFVFAALYAESLSQPKNMLSFPEPHRPNGQTNALRLACPPLDTVRIGFIGLGERGGSMFRRMLKGEGVKAVALCGLVQA